MTPLRWGHLSFSPHSGPCLEVRSSAPASRRFRVQSVRRHPPRSSTMRGWPHVPRPRRRARARPQSGPRVRRERAAPGPQARRSRQGRRAHVPPQARRPVAPAPVVRPAVGPRRVVRRARGTGGERAAGQAARAHPRRVAVGVMVRRRGAAGVTVRRRGAAAAAVLPAVRPRALGEDHQRLGPRRATIGAIVRRRARVRLASHVRSVPRPGGSWPGGARCAWRTTSGAGRRVRGARRWSRLGLAPMRRLRGEPGSRTTASSTGPPPSSTRLASRGRRRSVGRGRRASNPTTGSASTRSRSRRPGRSIGGDGRLRRRAGPGPRARG